MSTEDTHLYHATRPAFLESIRSRGLLVNDDRDQTFDGYPVDGRLYLSTSASGVAFYARALEAFLDDDETAAVIRVPCDGIHVHADELGNPNDVFTLSSIEPGRLEILVEGDWVSLDRYGFGALPPGP